MPKFFSKEVTPDEDVTSALAVATANLTSATAELETVTAELAKAKELVASYEKKEKVLGAASKLNVELDAQTTESLLSVDYPTALEQLMDMSAEQKGAREQNFDNALNPSVGDTAGKGAETFTPKTQAEAIDYYIAKFPNDSVQANVELARKNHINLFQGSES
jgi:hypothetical protein